MEFLRSCFVKGDDLVCELVTVAKWKFLSNFLFSKVVKNFLYSPEGRFIGVKPEVFGVLAS